MSKERIPISEDKAAPEILDHLSTVLPEHSQHPAATRRDHALKHSVLGAALHYRTTAHKPGSTMDSDLAELSVRAFDWLWPQDQSQSVACSTLSTRQSVFDAPCFNVASRARTAGNDAIEDIKTVYQSIPRSIDMMQTVREDHFGRVASEYAFQILGLWFLTPLPTIHDSMASQIRGSITVRAMYLGVTVFQALQQGPQASDAAINRYISCINDFEGEIAINVRRNPSSSDMLDRFRAHLELVFLKYSLVDGVSAYTLLRTALPMFLSFISTESDLLIDQPNGSLAVSFANTLRSPRHELARFVGNDVILPFLLGAPPLAEYAYERSCDHDQFEWVHGIPISLFQTVSQVNSWRAGSKVFLEDWQTLEQRTLAWRSPYDTSDVPFVPESATSEMAAVREGWRYVVLIYIYMGVCGVSSHDSRVQASVDRIFQLSGTVRSSHIGMHMLPHYFVAGVAARLERHRVAVYEKLLSFTGSRPWLFGGPQLGLFLYRLWRGVGTGGGAVTWDDYVRSRQAVAPI
ncbi:unnamed protein product [Rhizoctonia solani]|uniref:Uncharacterized protein n=1 Tax=Rhizoctonia solani TaxID=456999 RepID=A0A8H2W8T5_9AGAM|nr:unnamed protein product [Rhizoctonia solani]